MKLVDDADEQRVLEELLDESKPPVPADCAHLHYLLFTPFRYEARSDSRFRRIGATPPAFYASEAVSTAITEIAFWRLLFFAESPQIQWPANPLELTAFSVRYRGTCLDLTDPPYTARADEWVHPTDYTSCHAVSDEARAMGAQVIRSWSARDPDGGANVTLLSCQAFARPAPVDQQTWRMKLSAAGVYARGETAASALIFDRQAFARDSRIARLSWNR